MVDDQKDSKYVVYSSKYVEDGRGNNIVQDLVYVVYKVKYEIR